MGDATLLHVEFMFSHTVARQERGAIRFFFSHILMMRLSAGK
jgi:hypothetical protein